MVLGKIFIILQNVVTMVMLTSALVIWLQLNHLIHAPLGYNTENLFVINAPDGKHQTVRSLLEKMPFVEKIGMFEKTSLATGSCSMQSVTRNDKLVILYLLDLDKTAYNLYGFKKKKDYGQTSDGYYLTEETMRQMEYTDTTTQTVWNKPIAGVLNDIHRINVLQGVEPFVIQFKDSFNYPSYLVKTNGDKQAKATFTAMLKEQGVPEADMEWYVQSLEESIADTFADQRNTLKIISLFTIIAIVISILGYIGMSLFFIRQRQKEIAIRKVMGSTSGEVLLLMLRTFSIPMLISFVIAVPVSWYFMRDWLSNFSYRIALSPWIFAVAGFTCFIISVLTVIIQSWRAASENPINNIKTE
jgi:putative ABC transport system permease protein